MAFSTPFLSFAFLFLVSILTFASAEIVKMDFEEDMAAIGFFYDHVESKQYFETMEEYLGVWDISQQNNTRRGIWVFKSYGVGGCCGGLVDIRLYGQTFWTTQDKVEMEVKYFSNVNIEIGPVEGMEGAQEHEIIPPSEGEPLNWTVVRRSLNTTSTQRIPVDLHTSLGVIERRGYLILDSITFYVNEN